MKRLVAIATILVSFVFVGVAIANEPCPEGKNLTLMNQNIQVMPAGRGVLDASWTELTGGIYATHMWVWKVGTNPLFGYYWTVEGAKPITEQFNSAPTNVAIVGLQSGTAYNLILSNERASWPTSCYSNWTAPAIGVSQ